MIFIDTAAFVARYIEQDQHHAAAVDYWDELARQSIRCITSNFVLSESLTLLGRRTTYQFAAERARHLYASDVLEIVRPGIDDELQAVLYFKKYADQAVSFTDCLSFSLMRRLEIIEAFSFDQHFMMAGFEIRPHSEV